MAMIGKLLVVIMALALYQSDARAVSSINDATDEIRVAKCIRQAAGGQRWLEMTLWALRDQEGGWIGAEVENHNGSHDLGPLQINSWWVPKIAQLLQRPPAQVRSWLRFDPCFNASAARWIFVSAMESVGNYWTAVGLYHSSDPARQRRYVIAVADRLQRRYGTSIFQSDRSGKRRKSMRICVKFSGCSKLATWPVSKKTAWRENSR